MPTYVYRCKYCHTEFEDFQHRMPGKSHKACPKCGAKARKCIGGGHSIIVR